MTDFSLHDEHGYRWIVEFTFRCHDDRQRQIIDSIGILAYEVVRLFCEVCCPGSVVIEDQGKPIHQIACRTRAQARKIIRAFGGRLNPNLPSDLLHPVDHRIL